MDEIELDVKDEADYDINEFKIESFDIDVDDELTLTDCSESLLDLEEDIDDMWKSTDTEIRYPDIEIDLGDFKTTFGEWGSNERHQEEILNQPKPEVVEVVSCPAEIESSADEKEGGDRSYKCSFCQRSYTRKCGLISHQRIAHVDVEKRLKKYNCNKRKTGLKKCAPPENGVKTSAFECSLCPFSFASETLLKAHMKSHSGFSISVGTQSARTFTCTVCNASHKTHDNLVYHMFEHTKKMEYTCFKPNTTFDYAECLQSAECPQEQVLGLPPSSHPCASCEEVFENSQDLEQHAESRHSLPKKMATCPLCKKTFDVDSLRRHSLSHSHEKPFRCEYCKVDFISVTYFFKHLHATPGTCDFRTSRPAAVSVEATTGRPPVGSVEAVH